MVYRPQDVYINELFGGVAQIDAGVTAVDGHQSDPSFAGTFRRGDRGAPGRRPPRGFRLFRGLGREGEISRRREAHPRTALFVVRPVAQHVHGRRDLLPGYEEAWKVGRELDLPIALHVVGTFGMQPTFDALASAGQFGPDCFFIHMTGMSDIGWKAAADAGAHVTLRGADRNADAARDAADPEGARPRDEPVAVDRRRVHDDRGHVHPDAGRASRCSACSPTSLRCRARSTRSSCRSGTRCSLATMGGARGLRIDSQDRLADPGQGGRHHPARRDGAQRHAAQSCAGRRRYADGSLQRVDGAVRRPDQEVARRRSSATTSRSCGPNWRRAATMSSPRRESSKTCSAPERPRLPPGECAVTAA